MLKEIHEQPDALRQSLAGRVTPEGRIQAPGGSSARGRVPAGDAGRAGRVRDASYAALVGAAAIQDWTGLPARVTVGSEFRYSRRRSTGIAGHRRDPVGRDRRHDRADALAREQGCPIIAVTNTLGSAITREADAVMFLQAGPEMAVAACKTFVTQVTTLVVLAAAIAKARGSMAGTQELALGQALRALPTAAAAGARANEPRSRGSRAGTSTRGASCSSAAATRYPAALEGALKLKEISYVHAEGYAAGELKHGPISLLDAECPLVSIATRSPTYDKLISNVMEGRARDARVIAVATEGDAQISRFADDILWVADTHEALSPALAVIPLQLFAYHTAVARGTDVDQPRNLAKSVTVE